MSSEQKSAIRRLEWLFDNGIYTEIGCGIMENDSPVGVITAFGKIGNRPAYAYSQDISVDSGAVGLAHADKICAIFELAAKTGAPVVAIHDSSGALLENPQSALSAYGKMLQISANISGVVPQISVVAGVCAGSAAMLAASSDVVIMTENAELFLTPNMPSDAENASKNGIADIICVTDKDAVENARRIVAMLPANNISPIPFMDYEENVETSGINSVIDKGSEIILGTGFGSSADTAFASIKGKTVGIASISSGKKLSADDCSKLARFIRLCDAYSVPTISFVDTDGFEDSGDAVRNCTKLANAYADATTVKIAIITGKAIGSAYIAIAGKNSGSDFTFALPDAIISPMLPETAVEFFRHDDLKGVADVAAERKRLADEYSKNEVSAQRAAESGCIDAIISHDNLREPISSALEILAGKRVSGLPKKHTARA